MADQQPPKSDRVYYLFALKIAGNFGLAIAAPVIIFVLMGQYLDQRYGKSPWFTVLAFILAAVLSAKLVYQKAKKYGEEYKKL